MQRRKFGRDFKLQAVGMVRERGVTTSTPDRYTGDADPLFQYLVSEAAGKRRKTTQLHARFTFAKHLLS